MADETIHTENPENMPERKPKKNFWNKICDSAKWIYDSVKKICPQVKNLDEAFHSEDPLKIASTVMNEGGKLIGGDIGKAMRFGHDITNAVSSDNLFDGTAQGITSAMRYADFGKKGNRMAENLSSGLHNIANSQEIDKKIRKNLDKNIETARRRYEFAQTTQKEEYGDVMALEIRRLQAANARRNIQEKHYAEPASDDGNIQDIELATDINTLPDSPAPRYDNENEKTLSTAEKLTALRTIPARTAAPRQPRPVQNTRQAVPARETYTH